MPTWDRNSYYYSGQGVVMLARRDASGNPKGFEALGNCPAAQITIETTNTEHKESQSGQRATDLRLVTDTQAAIALTLENYAADVLARALRGDHTAVAAGTVSSEGVTLFNGKILPFARKRVSAVTLSRGAQALTPYVDDATPWDYKLNGDAGSVLINDGSVTAIDKLTTGGTAPSAISVGATTSITVANSAAVGDYVSFTGFTGADAALINGKRHKILTASSTAITIDLNTTGKTITVGTPLSAFDGVALTAAYTFAAQNQVDALTQGQIEYFLRFEGLNTADGNNPVILEAFRVVFDPTQAKDLINDENPAQFVLNGSILSDSTRSSGSKFFRETLVR